MKDWFMWKLIRAGEHAARLRSTTTNRGIKMGDCTKNVKHMLGALLLSLLTGGAAAGEAGQEEGELYHEENGRHTLGVFLGITREHDHDRETIGIEYSYRINRNWSVGALVERAEREKSSTLTNVFIHFWPTEFLYIGAGFGRKDPGEERQHTGRVTLGYEIELGKSWSLSPQANVDFIEDEENEEVFGLVFGRRF